MYTHWDSLDASSEAGVVVAFLPTPASFELVAEGTQQVYSAYPLTQRDERYTGNHPGTRPGTNQVRLKSGSAIEIHEAHLAESATVTSAGLRAEYVP